MSNGMYLMKLKSEADISSSLTQLSNSIEVERVERAWVSDNADFMFPANKLVVYFKNENAKYIADSIALANNIPKYKMFLGRENCYLFETQTNSYTNALNLANQIYESGLALFSQIDFMAPITMLSMPNDPLYPYQWNLNNTGQGGGTADADMDLEEAWEYVFSPRTEGLLNMNIVILDDGIPVHEDLPYCPNNIYFDDYDITKGPPGQNQYHGTAIAGILKGITDNGIGMSGMLRSTDCTPSLCYFDFILQCQVICSHNWDGASPYPYGLTTPTLLAEAIYDAGVSLHAFVISISLDIYPSAHIDSAIVSANDSGATIFAAAGNKCSSPANVGLAYPARNDRVIGVGATNNNDVRTHYSQYGIFNPLYGQIGVDFLAPSRDSCQSGVGIVTTDQMGIWNGIVLENGLSCFDTTLSSHYLCDFGGTSAACPQAAAIAMMLFGRRGDFRGGTNDNEPSPTLNVTGTYRPTPEVIREIIRYSCEDVYNNDELPGVEDTAWINEAYGWGRVNAARALLAVSRGNVDNVDTINHLDIVYLINFKYHGGAAPTPNELLGDSNCSGNFDILDIVYLINYVHKGGPRPPLCYKFQGWLP